MEIIQLQNRLSQNRVSNVMAVRKVLLWPLVCVWWSIIMYYICYKTHQNLPLTKNHQYVLLVELTQPENPALISSKSPLYQKHPQELLKLCCQDSEMLVCCDCVLVTHRSYNYSYVDEVSEKEKANLTAITLYEIEQMLISTSQTTDEVAREGSK